MSAKRVQRLFSGEISVICFLGSAIVAKAGNILIHTNPSTKFLRVFAEMNAKKSSFVSAAQFMLILAVFGSRCFSEIVKSIIRPISVFVVYITAWNTSGDIKKSKPLRPIGLSIESYRDVPATMKMPCDSANLDTKGWRFKPMEQSSLRAIVQNFAQSFGGNVCRIFNSHDAPPVRLDQRRGRVDSACLALSLYHLKNALLRLEALEIEGS